MADYQKHKNNKKNTNCITTFKKAYTYGIVDSDKFISCTIKMFLVYGVWRSLVARTAGGREVAGSNPVAPISH